MRVITDRLQNMRVGTLAKQKTRIVIGRTTARVMVKCKFSIRYTDVSTCVAGRTIKKLDTKCLRNV